jgi:hypothetical protein
MMLDENASDDEVLSGVSVNPQWGSPVKFRTDFQFILHQNQVWLNRQSLLIWLENEIAIVKANHIPGINNYWDRTKCEYLRGIQQMLRDLQPEGPCPT